MKNTDTYIKEVVGKIDKEQMSQEELLDAITVIGAKTDSILSDKKETEKELKAAQIVVEYENPQAAEKRMENINRIREKYADLMSRYLEINSLGEKVRTKLEDSRYFKKTRCLNNIRYLLKKNPDIKIGQIEKEAGVSTGYMSRLEKMGNTAEPVVEFIATAAMLLKVSLDTLLLVDLEQLTPTENYLVAFIDKLKLDTIDDKLEWNRVSADSLNRMEAEPDGYVTHPLFDERTFYEEGEAGYPEEVTRVVFESKAFAYNTYINGDCYSLKMKNNATLYLMDICKNVYRTSEHDVTAREIWISTNGCDRQYLFGTSDDTPLADIVEKLFEAVEMSMKHPKLNRDVKNVLDAFMQDDWEQDELELPFN